jgi:hypothetical protein
MDRKSDEKDQVYERLDLLSPEATPPVRVARSRLESKVAEKEQSMWQKILNRRYRPVWATLAVILVLTVSFSFPQVRAAAISFLGLFRVEQIEAVEIGISLDDLSGEMETQFMAIDNLIGDQIVVEQSAKSEEVADLSAAEVQAGFDARVPAQLQDQTKRVVFQPEASIRFTIDRDRWQALLDSMGYGNDFQLPEAADGAEVRFNVPNAIVTGFGDCEVNQAKDMQETELSGNCTVLLQTRQPTIEAPPGIDIHQAGQVMLQILGMSPEEAEAFSNRVDWATTLVVPVPQGADYRNVLVDGVEGVLLEDTYTGGHARFTLLWVKDGMFYALTGDGLRYSPVNIANSMK